MYNFTPPNRQGFPPLVLVVDDEPGIVDFLRFALEDNGYRVNTARDGSDALTKIAAERPDYLLTDLMMPRLNGWELCERLRTADTTSTLPIIGMSAVEPNNAKLDVFLRKPFELDDLLDALAGLTLTTPPQVHEAAMKPLACRETARFIERPMPGSS